MSQAPNWELSDDGKHVTVTFPSIPPVALKLDAGQVDEVLRNLGEFRANMTPEHSATFAPSRKVGAVPDPKWYTEPEVMQGHTLLHLRDPRYGWLSYLLPRPEASKLAGYLKEQAEAPQTPASRSN